MQFPKSLHADGWYTHLHRVPLTAHDLGDGTRRSSRSRRRWQAAVGLAALAALTTGLSLQAMDDARPLDDQLRSTLHAAGGQLGRWQTQLSHGLQASLQGWAGRDHAVLDAAAGYEADDIDTPPEAAPGAAPPPQSPGPR